MGKSSIRLEKIRKSYGESVILDDLDLDIPENAFVTLLGPSGCGKTTTLRIIGGFEQADSGRVIFDGLQKRYSMVARAICQGID